MNRVWTWAHFIQYHKNINSMLLRYSTQPTGRWKIHPEVVDDLMSAESYRLPSINLRSRTQVAKYFNSETNRWMNKHGSRDMLFFTFAPERFAKPVSLLDRIDVADLASWCRGWLSDMNYIACIEVALYTDGANSPLSRTPMVSWHMHALAWGIDKMAAKEMVAAINEETSSLIPGIPAAHVRRVISEEVEAQISYMLKGPWQGYRVHPRKSDIMNLNWNQQDSEVAKRPYRQESAHLLKRPKWAAMSAKTMAKRTLHDLTFANGAGADIRSRALGNAITQIQRIDARCRKELLQLW